MVFLLTDAVGGKGIGSDDVGSGLDVEAVYVGNDIWSSEAKHVVVTHKRDTPISKASPMETLCRQPESLDSRTHRAVHYQDAFLQTIPYFPKRLFHFGCKGTKKSEECRVKSEEIFRKKYFAKQNIIMYKEQNLLFFDKFLLKKFAG